MIINDYDFYKHFVKCCISLTLMCVFFHSDYWCGYTVVTSLGRNFTRIQRKMTETSRKIQLTETRPATGIEHLQID